ncbi:ABC transporter ATP-binding protein [Thiomicrorhabdus sp. 6S3-12]|uniref:ABC transporter ATP-binding protein n=1 Tax=Thiomicrorhabdus sp. 6S3-12 TaxID=2819681 RepID=UPI001AAC4C34|nr:ABC transporter ATP-binding protein [Thiomicrorhabdus sp. 6S3-12]MBO1923397.1 ABC transporter ATP-binding protein [Thiomicrorhabdus sp. 6S3-12]
MPELNLHQVQASHQAHTVVNRIDLRLREGEIGCLLGPSGCGKTTLLRTIAGLHAPSGGEIRIGETLMASDKVNVPTEKRKIGMVFQDYALFPHMTVYDNIAFGLDKFPAALKRERIQQLLELIGLPHVGDRYPHQLSGGQQQRIALARALAPRPTMLLMDEPFSGLDVELRESLAREVRGILKSEGISALMVTHNQNEAFAMADSVGVLKDGRLLQWDTPYNLYHQPLHPFIADFIGQGSLISGRVCDCRAVHTELGLLKTHLPFGTESGEEVSVLVRPDDIIHDDSSDWKLEVVNRAFRGSHFLFTLKLPSGEKVMCMSQSHHDHPVGSKIGIKLEMDHAVVFPKALSGE